MPTSAPFARSTLVDKIMQTAIFFAGATSDEGCGSQHILLALSHEGLLAREVLALVGISERLLLQQMEDIREQRHNQPGLPELAPPPEDSVEIMALAEREARKFGSHVIGDEHLLLALLLKPDSNAAWILGSAQRSALRATVIQLMSGYRQVGEGLAEGGSQPERNAQAERNGERHVQSDHRQRIPKNKRKDLVSYTGTGVRVAIVGSMVVVFVLLVHQWARSRAAPALRRGRLPRS